MDVLAAQPTYPSAIVIANFTLPESNNEIEVRGEVAWANPNGQSGVRFVDMTENLRTTLQTWVLAHAQELPPEEPEPVAHCKLTDLSLGGCYVETESPFPERSGIILCLKAEDMEVQAEGMVRVMHPAYGMGIEFAARTPEQRAHVESFIGFLSSRPGTTPELLIMPRALAAHDDPGADDQRAEELDDPLLDLLRNHQSLAQEDFLQALRNQRSSEEVPQA
jgi:PilZ domain